MVKIQHIHEEMWKRWEQGDESVPKWFREYTTYSEDQTRKKITTSSHVLYYSLINNKWVPIKSEVRYVTYNTLHERYITYANNEITYYYDRRTSDNS